MAQPSRRQALALLLSALGTSLAPAEALARAKRQKVVWSGIIVREGEDKKRVERTLKSILDKESRKAKWGKARPDPIEARLHVTELKAVNEGDVVRITCAAAGKIEGLGVARSKFSYGGSVNERAKLEYHVLELVSRGVITRLAELARTQQEESSWRVTR